MADDIFTQETVDKLNASALTFNEVVTSRAGGVSSGAIIDQTLTPLGETTDTLKGRLDKLGVHISDWASTDGGTLTSPTQAFLNNTSGSVGFGNYYSWSGAFPKTVAPGTDPAAVGSGYTPRTDVVLRNELAADGGANLVGPGVISRGNDKFSILQGRTGEQFGGDVTRGLGILLAEPITGMPPNASTAKINYIRIEDDQLNAVDDAAPGTKVDGLLINHSFGGSAAKGGRHAGEFILTHNLPTSSENQDRNYAGLTGWAHSSQGDGGTSDSDVRGAYFGANFLATLGVGAMYTTNLTGAEFNVSIPNGASTRIRTGIQVGGAGQQQGTVIDAALCVGNKVDGVAWRNGIRISNQNGGQALDVNSKVLVATAATTVQSGFEIPKCAQSILLSGDVGLTNNKLAMSATGSSIELGSRSAASTVFIDANTSGNDIDYDARLQFSGGSASVGTGNASLVAGIIQLSSTTEIVMGSTIRPGADNAYDYGTASRRGRTAYFGTGTINTSDAREKTAPLPIDDAVLDAWGDIQYIAFQWLDAIQQKGEDMARWHFGVIAQQVRDAFICHGLDGTKYGLLCYDEWGASDAVVDDNGNVVTESVAAGNRWGIRADQCLFLEAAYQRRRCERIEARLAAAGL